MNWNGIPSLSALRAFEAAARLNNFSAAARELNVTQAAVAQHVRGLETHFGQSLLFRQGKKMELTANGARLADTLSDGFLTIQTGVKNLLAEKEDRPLSISTTPSFAENWLMPRLGQFWAKHPEIELAILPSANLVDMRREGVDLAVRFGDGKWPQYDVRLLMPAKFVVVANRQTTALQSINKLSDLAGQNWLLETGLREPVLWAREQGLDLDTVKTTFFATSSLKRSAARAGYGLAILPEAVVEHDLQTGALFKVFAAESDCQGYFLVTQKAGVSKRLDTFVKWLKAMA